MKKKNRINVLLRNRIHEGKSWWKYLDDKDKVAFIGGFIKNKNAAQIQKEEIESNKRRLLSKEKN